MFCVLLRDVRVASVFVIVTRAFCADFDSDYV